MPTLNFHERFADQVETGAKRQTIRAGENWRPGLTAHLWTGQRLPISDPRHRKLGIVRVRSVMPVRITENGIATRPCDRKNSVIASQEPGRANRLAKRDGFKNWKDMLAWFKKTHGLPFNGQLIRW